MSIIILSSLLKEANDYAELSGEFTSNRHDFHTGGLSNKKIKMYEGKLGEKIFKQYLMDNNIQFIEDNSSYREADNYDFLIKEKRIDIKTRTKNFHTRTLEMVEQVTKRPKDIYISVKLNEDKKSGSILGWFFKEDMLEINRIEKNGYLDNYVLFDHELRPINTLLAAISKI